jgi:hypothetical protein
MIRNWKTIQKPVWVALDEIAHFRYFPTYSPTAVDGRHCAAPEKRHKQTMVLG